MEGKKEKIAMVRVRIDPQIKNAFDNACKSNDLSASQVIRAFINDYLKKNGQKDLFKS